MMAFHIGIINYWILTIKTSIVITNNTTTELTRGPVTVLHTL